jgi:hypothetical protein
LISRCKGFPVDVYFSGQYDYEKREIAQNLLIPSDHRQGSGFEPFECGFISYDLSKLKGSGSFCGLNYIAYLQGFPILGWDHFSNRIVVHLNKTFKARMPDRDCLINENDQRDIITQAVYAFLRNKLLELKAIDKREVLSYYALASAIGCLDIFNDIDELPVDFFCTLQSVHKEYQDYCMERSYLTMTEAGTEFFSREYLSKQLIVSDIADGDNGDDDFSMALNMALMQSEALIMACSLDPEHWIQTIVLDSPSMAHHKDEPTDRPTEPPVSVEYTPLKATVWYGITVYLVDQYTINVPSLGLSVVVDGDHGLALGGDENAYRPDGTVAQDIFLLPPRADSDVLTQVRNWYWDDSYHDDAAEEDQQSLQGVIDLLRGTNESDVLKVLLGRTDFSVRKALTGQTFQVTFFEDGELEVRAAA